MIGIQKEFRGMGLGRTLLKLLEATAREMGLERLELIAANTNLAALRLYESAGFVKKGEKPWFYLAKDEKNRLT